MNLKKMMQQAQKMQEQMLAAQEQVAKKTVEATAAGGKVTVVATGGGDIVSLKIAKEIVDPEDVEFLERLILETVKKAIEDARTLQQGEMGKFIPPGMGGLGF
jgi:DNA-binding YbaB/EbfC family protein